MVERLALKVGYGGVYGKGSGLNVCRKLGGGYGKGTGSNECRRPGGKGVSLHLAICVARSLELLVMKQRQVFTTRLSNGAEGVRLHVLLLLVLLPVLWDGP